MVTNICLSCLAVCFSGCFRSKPNNWTHQTINQCDNAKHAKLDSVHTLRRASSSSWTCLQVLLRHLQARRTGWASPVSCGQPTPQRWQPSVLTSALHMDGRAAFSSCGCGRAASPSWHSGTNANAATTKNAPDQPGGFARTQLSPPVTRHERQTGHARHPTPSPVSPLFSQWLRGWTGLPTSRMNWNRSRTGVTLVSCGHDARTTGHAHAAAEEGVIQRLRKKKVRFLLT